MPREELRRGWLSDAEEDSRKGAKTQREERGKTVRATGYQVLAFLGAFAPWRVASWDKFLGKGPASYPPLREVVNSAQSTFRTADRSPRVQVRSVSGNAIALLIGEPSHDSSRTVVHLVRRDTQRNMPFS
jgi:hypothetical protein